MTILVSVAAILGAGIGTAISRFLDKSGWRQVAEARGAEIEDQRREIEELKKRVQLLESQVQGVAAIKSEQIAHMVIEGLQQHRGTEWTNS